MTVAFRVFGAVGLTTADGRDLEILLRQPKRIALLAYLATAVPRGFHRRDTLVGMYWPELDATRARSALNQALYVLRSSLGDDAILTRGSEEIALNDRAVGCDARAFEDALDAGRPAEALVLYRGDLLEGYFVDGAPEFERWLDGRRERLRQRAYDGAWALAEELARAGDAIEAARRARFAADLLPADETALRRLITFLHRLGDRAGAVRVYEAFADRLNREYELEPSAETQALAVALREEGKHPAKVRWVGVASAFPDILISMKRRLPLAGLALPMLALIVGSMGTWMLVGRRDPPAPPLTRFTLELRAPPPVAEGVTGSTVALSPDGRQVVYLGAGESGRQLFRRPMDALDPVALPHTGGAYLPFFSPDGSRLGFVAGDRLRWLSLHGGPPITVCRVGRPVQGASWGPDDVIVYSAAGALWQVDAGGGEARVLLATDSARRLQYRWPDVLPGGHGVVFTMADSTGFQLAALSLKTGAVRMLGREGTSPRFVAPGYLVFARTDGALLAAPFDERRLAFTGPTIPLADGVIVGFSGAAKLDVSRSGALVYVPERTGDRTLVLVSRDGSAEPLPVPPQGYQIVRLSPDGRRILAQIAGSGGGQQDLWVLDLERNTSERVTFDGGARSPAWSRDGDRIAWGAMSGNGDPGAALLLASAGGTVPPEALLGTEHGRWPLDFTPDGRALVLVRTDAQSRGDVWILSLADEPGLTPWLQTPSDESVAKLSPDGRWLAYVSDETGRHEVYVRAFPTPGPAVRISEAGGTAPRWSPRGDAVFYRGSGRMIEANVRSASPLTVERRVTLFDDRSYFGVPTAITWDVHPDGRRFLMIRRGSESDDLVVVLNWFAQPHLRR